MYIVKFTTKFKKRYKTLVKRGYDMSLIDKVIDVLREGRSLDGKYKDVWCFRSCCRQAKPLPFSCRFTVKNAGAPTPETRTRRERYKKQGGVL